MDHYQKQMEDHYRKQKEIRKQMQDHYRKQMELQKFCAPLKQFSVDQTYISLTLAKRVISYVANDKNLVFSPLSIHVVFGLIAAGSTGRPQKDILSYLNSDSVDDFGSSLSQLTEILFADGSSIGGPCLSYANGVWVDKSLALKTSFKVISENVYKAVTKEVDFKNQAETERKKLNLWAEEQTNGLIKDILPPKSITADTKLVFGNAVYFKGAWDKIFIESSTRDYDFFLLDGNQIKVPFMTNFCHQRVRAFDGFKVLGLEYKQGEDLRKFVMYIFLPDSKDGLPALVEKVTSQPGFIEDHLPCQYVAVGKFRIPKFKICFDFDAKNVLKELGLEAMYTSNLTELVEDDEDVMVTSILHKSCIDVKEEGTKAAAVTYAPSAPGYCPNWNVVEKKIDFVAEHPFLFLIREEITGMLLFCGCLLNPLLE